ncbi:MAG: ABC transporter ATP-binding protein [Pseudomonadales bacterium]
MTSALSIKGLKKTYPNGFEALKSIDLEVAPGDFFALLGPNGAGKSTTIGVICSLINKSDGDVSVFGHNVDTDFSLAKQCLGVVPQEFNFNQFEKVFNIVTTQAGYYGIPKAIAEVRAEKYLKKLGLWEKRNEISRTLSGGMKRRLMIARALVHEPKLLILDEPTAGVDIEIRRSMWEFLQEINAAGTTIILTTHYLEEAEQLCRNVAIIDNGVIVENASVKDLLKRLSRQTYVFDTVDEIDSSFTVAGLIVNVVDPHSFEVEVGMDTTMNQVFEALSRVGVNIGSMRNKANRLEELFMSLVNSGSQS